METVTSPQARAARAADDTASKVLTDLEVRGIHINPPGRWLEVKAEIVIALLTFAAQEAEPANARLKRENSARRELQNQFASEIARFQAALGFIESAALFHPDQVWPDEMKAQLRRIGKLASEALRAAPTPKEMS